MGRIILTKLNYKQVLKIFRIYIAKFCVKIFTFINCFICVAFHLLIRQWDNQVNDMPLSNNNSRDDNRRDTVLFVLFNCETRETSENFICLSDQSETAQITEVLTIISV